MIPGADFKDFASRPLATIAAMKDGYILSARMFGGQIYPPVNDAGERHALVKVNSGGAYEPLEFANFPQVFRLD